MYGRLQEGLLTLPRKLPESAERTQSLPKEFPESLQQFSEPSQTVLAVGQAVPDEEHMPSNSSPWYA